MLFKTVKARVTWFYFVLLLLKYIEVHYHFNNLYVFTDCDKVAHSMAEIQNAISQRLAVEAAEAAAVLVAAAEVAKAAAEIIAHAAHVESEVCHVVCLERDIS